jgi:O-antigen/teichoic acid export membrane protein
VEDKALRSIPLSLLSFPSAKVVTVVSTVLLARLLAPSDFGLLALAVLATGLLTTISDSGLGGTLVLRQDLDRRAQGTVLTVMVATSVALSGVLVALAPAVAQLFREPRLTPILYVTAGTLVLAGPSFFYAAVLQRELLFGRRFASEFVQTAVNVAVAFPLAFAGAGVWSLVLGRVSGIAAYVVCAFVLAPYRVRPRLDRPLARELVGQGKGFVLQGVVAFAQKNTDYIAVGRVLGARALGFYSMAYRLAELPYSGITEPVAKVTFPGFARMRHRGEEWRPAFLTTLRVTALVACPLGVLLSATSAPFTEAILGEKWLAMIGPLAVLGIWGAVRPVEGTIGWLLNSIGEVGYVARASLLALVVLIPGLVLAATVGGVTAVAAVMGLHMVVLTVVLALAVRRIAGVTLGAQWGAVAPVVLACTLTWGATRGLVEVLAALPAFATLAVASLGGAAFYAAIIHLSQPQLLSQAVSLVGRALASRRGEDPIGAAPGEPAV